MSYAVCLYVSTFLTLFYLLHIKVNLMLDYTGNLHVFFQDGSKRSSREQSLLHSESWLIWGFYKQHFHINPQRSSYWWVFIQNQCTLIKTIYKYHVCMHVCVYACINACTCICTHVSCLYVIRMHAHTHVCTYFADFIVYTCTCKYREFCAFW